MDSGGDMSGHRLPRLLTPSPRGRPYVLISVCKGILYFFNTQKKLQEIFKKYLILLIFNELQRGIFRGFFGVSVVKRFNGILLYIRYPAGVPYLAPYLIRAGQVSRPERRTDTRSKPHHIKPFYFSPAESGRYDWLRRERQTKLKRFNPGSPWRLIWTGQGRGSGGPAGRAGIPAGPGFLRGPGVHLQAGWTPAGLNVLIFR